MTKEITAEEKRLNHNIEYILFDYMEFEYMKECSEKIMQWFEVEWRKKATELIGEDDKPQLHTDPNTNAKYYLLDKPKYRNELRAELRKIVEGR